MSTPDATGHLRRNRRSTGVAALTLLLGLGLAGLAGEASAASPSRSGATAAATRGSVPPNVTYPVAASGHPADRLTFRRGQHNGTDIAAPCGTPVVAAHPGMVRVLANQPWAGGTLVKVFTSKDRLTTWYAYLRNITVKDNQLVQAGQQLGEVGNGGKAAECALGFHVRNRSTRTIYNPSTWLGTYVGRTVPVTQLFGNKGFVLASLNMLGASHTDKGGDAASRYPSYEVRMPRQIATLNQYAVDVAGLQEFQKRQRAMFVDRAGSTYDVYPSNPQMDTENSIIWRRSAFELIEARTFDVPYFNGVIRHMPYLLLRQRSTGIAAYFINVHNPANTGTYRNQEKYRAKAIATERALIIKLRATGKAVFLTGDLNDRAAAYCPLAEGKLVLAANSVPSTSCAPPPNPWIDWVLAAGPARFTTYVRDWAIKDQMKAADHPIVLSRTYLAG